MSKQTTYVVSTLNKDGSISKKMFNSFSVIYPLDFEKGYHFTDKKMAFKRRWQQQNSIYSWVSEARWVVINTKTMKVVHR